MSAPIFTRFPERRLCVEVQYTRDDVVDNIDGSWSHIPQPPSSHGWLLWDIWPDRKSGWLRVWRRGVGLALIAGWGCA
jgi:hypothetical protein